MTHDSLLELVDLVNSQGAAGRIFLRPLIDGVDLGYAWATDPTGCSASESCSRVYFLRGSDGTCIGAVDDLSGDIHAVMKPNHRRRGAMLAAMRDVILPHMFLDGRTILRTRLCSPEGRALALKLGFTLADRDWAEITPETVPARVFPESLLPPLDATRAKAVENRIRNAVACLRRVRADLQHRTSPAVLNKLDFAAHWSTCLVEPDSEYFESEAPEPSLPPLAEPQQREMERLIYEAAAWLRMAADELEGRRATDRVDEARRLAIRIIGIGQDIRDDWYDRQTRRWIDEQRKPSETVSDSDSPLT